MAAPAPHSFEENMAELNRRLDGTKVDIIETLESKWFELATSRGYSLEPLHLTARVHQIATARKNAYATPKNVNVAEETYMRFGAAGVRRYTREDAPSVREVAATYLGEFFAEAKQNAEYVPHAQKSADDIRDYFARAAVNLTASIDQNTFNPKSATGWALNWGLKLQDLVRWMVAADDATARILADATLGLAQESLDALIEGMAAAKSIYKKAAYTAPSDSPYLKNKPLCDFIVEEVAAAVVNAQACLTTLPDVQQAVRAGDIMRRAEECAGRPLRPMMVRQWHTPAEEPDSD